ncbi:MAG TPA: tetratricopeptide repeat protein [Candidatus Paceibacterota bacterium]|nr:tetratricopeptide repeat protein [Verrucomicrobiota bacterium]HRY50115.1 tetratricopeptide repeat protein [Candidatus Paceibacterota bacterium]
MNPETSESVRIYEWLAWLETNKKKLIVGAVVVAAISLVFSFVRYQARERESAANAALFKLGLPLRQDEMAPKPNASGYLKVASDYASTQTGQRAFLMGAGQLFSENNYAGALEQFRKFLSAHGSSPLASVASMGVAACLDAQDKVEEAVKAYQEVISRYSAEPVANQARMALARIHESKKQPEQALKLYDEVSRADSLSFWRNEISERRGNLLKEYPHLAPTNQVKPQAAAPALTPTNAARTSAPATNAANVKK